MPAAPGFAATRGKASTAAATPKAIWDALEAAGASAVQAAGIMGNMIAESRLNPESAAEDTNGYMAYGLVSWNAQDYPNAASLVTGHPLADLEAQVRFLAATGGFKAATGSTPAQAAASFAENYERCQTCQSGGAQNATRQANAQSVAGWAQAGAWPASVGAASDTASLTSAQAAQASATCAFGISGLNATIPVIPGIYHQTVGLPDICLLSNSQARAVEGGLIFAAGGVILGVGLILALVGAEVASARTQALASRVPGVQGVARATAGP
jgi:Phage tail lysozyme